jgi:hypothetical protein
MSGESSIAHQLWKPSVQLPKAPLFYLEKKPEGNTSRTTAE